MYHCKDIKILLKWFNFMIKNFQAIMTTLERFEHWINDSYKSFVKIDLLEIKHIITSVRINGQVRLLKPIYLNEVFDLNYIFNRILISVFEDPFVPVYISRW